MEQSGVKASGGKTRQIRSERSKNITERYKSRVKIEKKGVVRRSKRRVRKVVWSRLDQAVPFRTMQSKEKI